MQESPGGQSEDVQGIMQRGPFGSESTQTSPAGHPDAGVQLTLQNRSVMPPNTTVHAGLHATESGSRPMVQVSPVDVDAPVEVAPAEALPPPPPPPGACAQPATTRAVARNTLVTMRSSPGASSRSLARSHKDQR